MFGEVTIFNTITFIIKIMGVWCVHFLDKIKAINLENPNHNSQKKFTLLEFGPGRGTLMCDILRVLNQFNLLNGIELNFIEASPFMRKMQQENLQKLLRKYELQ